MSFVSFFIQINQYLGFIIFCIIFSFILAWLERKLVARMQNRVGPPLFQPIIDFLKLSAKEDIYINSEDKFVLKYSPIIQLILVLIILFMLPIFGSTSFLDFEENLFLFITLFTISSAIIFIIANFSKSPYTLIGGNRSIITEISLEIPLILAFAGLAIYTKSLNISEISANFLPKILQISSLKDLVYIIIFVVLFGIIVISYLGVLELNPFSTPKAETEIVAGWKTELTGKNLAIVELTEHLKVFIIAAFISTIFLGNSFYGFTYSLDLQTSVLFLVYLFFFSIKVIFVTFILMFLHAVSARSRIHTIAENFWFLLFISSVCIFGLVILEVI